MSNSDQPVCFDTHAHLADPHLRSQLNDVLTRATEAGVLRVIGIGTNAEDSAQYVEIASQFPGVSAAVGIQPNYVHEAVEGDWEKIVELAKDPTVIAIGETGLDRYWDDAPFDLQQDYFSRHLQLSRETGLPFIVHMRECEADVIEALEAEAQNGELKGVMHSYTGSKAGALKCIELGMHISFAGMVTFKKSAELREVAAAVPSDRILIETDSPYLSPEPFRGKRPNEPARVIHTAACIAEVRGESINEFSRRTFENSVKLFGPARREV